VTTPKTPLTYTVSKADTGLRLDVYLSQQSLPFSRSQLARRIEAGEVTIDGKPCRPGQKLRAGQILSFAVADPKDTQTKPENIPLCILFEDPHLIVVNKPAGLVVHPAPGHETGTLVSALLFHCGSLPKPPVFRASPSPSPLPSVQTEDAVLDEPDSDDDAEDLAVLPASASSFSIGGERRPGIVHRLDAGTSGVLVCAKDEPTLVGLQAQFQIHSIERKYVALVDGVLPDEGTFSTRYGRHPRDRKRFTARSGEKHAVTHFRTLERFSGATLVELRLETGRTHQIRVHLSEQGFPILGDPLYGRPSRNRAVQQIASTVLHQALHAQVLGFEHPRTGQMLRFSAPPPPDFLAALSALRAKPATTTQHDAPTPHP